jgi:pectate lyase
MAGKAFAGAVFPMKTQQLYLFAFLMLCLSACQSSLIADMVTQPGDRLFWDDFSDSSGNWPQVSGPNGSAGIVNGGYNLQVLSAKYEMIATTAHTFRDVQVEVDATRLAGPVQNLYGLVCRSSNSENFYFFGISSDGYFGVGKVNNGRVTLLGQKMMAFSPVILQGEPNHIRFECIGASLKGYVNGQVVSTARDGDFSSGEVGLVAGALDTAGVDVAFDNFVVYKP